MKKPLVAQAMDKHLGAPVPAAKASRPAVAAAKK